MSKKMITFVVGSSKTDGQRRLLHHLLIKFRVAVDSWNQKT